MDNTTSSTPARSTALAATTATEDKKKGKKDAEQLPTKKVTPKKVTPKKVRYHCHAIMVLRKFNLCTIIPFFSPRAEGN